MSDSGSSTSENEKPMDPEVGRKWSALVYKVYERMIHASEVSFFISSPQLISTLGFLLSACNSEEIRGLIEGLDDKKEKPQKKVLIEDTLTFVNSWNSEFRNLLGPGQYLQARRVYAHPKYVMPHFRSTYQYYCQFRVEEKIFEGSHEIKEWAKRTLKTTFAPHQRFLSTWRISDPPAQPVQSSKKGAIISEFSTKMPFVTIAKNLKKKKKNKSIWLRKDPGEQEKKPPILIWTSHAIVELPAEFFDAYNIYKLGGGNSDELEGTMEFLKVHSSPIHTIPVIFDRYAWKSLFLPTQNRKLTLIIIWDFDKELCSHEEMKAFVQSHRLYRPCIVKKRDVGAEALEKKEVYFPFWQTKDFPASRIAQHLVACMSLHSLFVAGGFGDLALPDAVPSASGDPKKVSHVQHFGLLSFNNCPKSEVLIDDIATRKNRPPTTRILAKTPRKIIEDPEDPDIEVIRGPICVILWDGEREMPAFMGKFTGSNEQEMERLERIKMGKMKKKSCC